MNKEERLLEKKLKREIYEISTEISILKKEIMQLNILLQVLSKQKKNTVAWNNYIAQKNSKVLKLKVLKMKLYKIRRKLSSLGNYEAVKNNEARMARKRIKYTQKYTRKEDNF